MHIGIFDSGLGGVNVLNELIKKYPNNHYTFIGDTKNLPYGTKSVEELNKLACNNIDFLISKGVDIIIIACGTISSNCYSYLLNKYNIPIYDIVSPTLEYINSTNYNNIGVIATNRTIDSHIFEKSRKVKYPLATPSFVKIIEDGIITKKEELEVERVLYPLKNNIDALILGCTHYPLLSNIITNYLSVPLIDMGKCLVDKLDIALGSNLKIDLFFTSLNNNVINNLKATLKRDYTLEEVDLS